MGWPDDHTRWTADGREIADTNRYKLCGNGVVSTVAEYIGHRLVHVDRNNHG
jgi:site-specific DNA-cytosine methylase